MSAMDTRVSKLANIVDDKTIIGQLIREKSSRIRLIEFKDARADIWQFFRLVCLDGVTLPYAVCVRCMKAVSYKAREGTGGLHRHPCSKQAIAAAIAAGIPFNTSANRSKAGHSSSSRASNASTSSKSVVPSTSASTSSATTVHNKLNATFKPNFAFNSLVAIEMVNNLAKNSRHLAQDLMGNALSQHSLDSRKTLALVSEQLEDTNNAFTEELLSLNILKLFCTELIPLEVLESESFQRLVQQLISFGAINGSINFDRFKANSLFANAFETSRLDFRSVLQKYSFITFVVDLWTQEITRRRFMTVWAHLADTQHNKDLCKIVVTKDISHMSSSEQLIKLLDLIRKDINESNSEFIYLFDNEFSAFDIEANDNFLFCVNHQLNRILDEMHSIKEFSQMFNEIKMITNIMENIDGFGLKFVTQGISNFNNWFQILKIFKLLKEFPNLKQILGEQQELGFVGKPCFDEITDFLLPFAEALNYFHFETDKSISTINLISLWRVKLENHCKSSESDSQLIKKVKDKLRAAILRSNLNHPIFLMAVCFDPRFKKLKMFCEDMRTKTYDIIRKQLAHFSHINHLQQPLCSPQDLSSDANSSDDSVEPKASKKFKAIEDKSTEAFTEYLDETNEEEKDELQRYLNLEVGQTQPLEFWCGEHSTRLPRLRFLAQRILSIPSVLSKCCHYSTSGEQLSIRRKALDPRYLDKVLLLNSHFSSI